MFPAGSCIERDMRCRPPADPNCWVGSVTGQSQFARRSLLRQSPRESTVTEKHRGLPTLDYLLLEGEPSNRSALEMLSCSGTVYPENRWACLRARFRKLTIQSRRLRGVMLY